MGTLWGWGWGVKRSYQKWVGEDNSLLGGLEMLKVRRGRVLGEPERDLLFGLGTSPRKWGQSPRGLGSPLPGTRTSSWDWGPPPGNGGQMEAVDILIQTLPG